MSRLMRSTVQSLNISKFLHSLLPFGILSDGWLSPRNEVSPRADSNLYDIAALRLAPAYNIHQVTPGTL